MLGLYRNGIEARIKSLAITKRWSPNNNKAFFVVAQPPQKLPMPSFDQNALQTIQLGFSITEYKGQDTAIEPAASNA